jgi:hypothetical protein
MPLAEAYIQPKRAATCATLFSTGRSQPGSGNESGLWAITSSDALEEEDTCVSYEEEDTCESYITSSDALI